MWWIEIKVALFCHHFSHRLSLQRFESFKRNVEHICFFFCLFLVCTMFNSESPMIKQKGRECVFVRERKKQIQKQTKYFLSTSTWVSRLKWNVTHIFMVQIKSQWIWNVGRQQAYSFVCSKLILFGKLIICVCMCLPLLPYRQRREKKTQTDKLYSIMHKARCKGYDKNNNVWK